MRGYHGTLCSDCLPGYRAAQKRCEQCTDLATISSKRMAPRMRFKQTSFDARHANVAPQGLKDLIGHEISYDLLRFMSFDAASNVMLAALHSVFTAGMFGLLPCWPASTRGRRGL